MTKLEHYKERATELCEDMIRAMRNNMRVSGGVPEEVIITSVLALIRALSRNFLTPSNKLLLKNSLKRLVETM